MSSFMSNNEEENIPPPERKYNDIILTLVNQLIPCDKLHPTPSMLDGLDLKSETDLRILGCEYIQSVGILLKLPQVAMATGQVLFQRFYYSKSMVKHNIEMMAMACINLASKIEECPRRPRDVVTVFHHIKQVRSQKSIQTMLLDHHYTNLKNQLIKAERRILKELGFCVHVKHPHKIIVMYLKFLELLDKNHLVQKAWNYMNDIFRTDVFVRFTPETIAAGCIQLAARYLKVALPSKPHWFHVFHLAEADIRTVCHILVALYQREKPNLEKLGQEVDRCKKAWLESKSRSKTPTRSEEFTPVITMQPDTPKASPNPAPVSSKRIKEEDRVSDLASENHLNKKRSRSNESDARSSGRSGRTRSRSRSRSTRSRSRSLSPVPKRRRHSPYHKPRRDHRRSTPDRYLSSKDKRSRKRKHRSRSFSRSPDRHVSKSHKKYKDYDRHAYSPDRHRSSRKPRNGHRSSPRDRYDKYRR